MTVSRRASVSGAVVLRVALVVSVVLVLSVAVVAVLVRTRDGGDGRGPSASPTSSVPPASGPGLSLQAPPPAAAVLEASSGGPAGSLSRLKRQLAPSLALPGSAATSPSPSLSSITLTSAGRTALPT